MLNKYSYPSQRQAIQAFSFLDFSFQFLFLLVLSICLSSNSNAQITIGAEKMNEYLPLLKNKKVALVVNQTSMVRNTHLVDTLLKRKVNILNIFAPEHGFRGDHSAGEKVKSGIDALTKLQVISLYGKNKKPTEAQMAKCDIVIFDIQDVGARFYTYISTLHYVMEACAESNKLLLILDRPNPNGYYVDGPVLDTSYRSFVGMHPVPIVHGMTVGEYAQMINGERWLKDSLQCKLQIIKCDKYTHDQLYRLPVKPSPNLPTAEAIFLYPSLCLFEGTNVSLGRGTKKPFECLGKPGNSIGDYNFTPLNLPGIAEKPPFQDTLCRGFLLSEYAKNFMFYDMKINLYWLKELYKVEKEKSTFFNSFFDKVAGNSILRKQIAEGKSEEDIRQSWQEGLQTYKPIRKKYLLYRDFTGKPWIYE
ncbi:MAG: DUF1343 domain-containing protein [Bacteroidetes bacterium]|nr:DUF1343 domain-containing protein [Bacteroidota bacterium]